MADKSQENGAHSIKENDTILDYIKWRGDISMLERPFNEVDDLIMSELAYLDLKGILHNYEDIKSLNEIADNYAALNRKQDYLVNDPSILLRAVKNTERFGNIKVGLYKDRLDALSVLQFAAMTFFLEDESLYVGFRGTDNTVVGWREDFTMVYLDATPGQIESASYLKLVLDSFDKKIRVGGHSKGGSFAVFAAAFARSGKRHNILSVSSHDGPGLSNEAIEQKEYEEILDKTIVYLPEESAIGILLSNKAKRCFVKSNAKGIMQHNPYSWLVKRESFVIAKKRSVGSAMLEEFLGQWIEDLTLEERENLVSVLFDSIDAAGADTFTEVNSNQLEYYNAILRQMLSLDEDRKKVLREAIHKFIDAGNDILKKEAGLKLKEIFKSDGIKLKNMLPFKKE